MGEYTNYLSIVTLDQDTSESPTYTPTEIFSTYFAGNPTKGLGFEKDSHSGDTKLKTNVAEVYYNKEYKWINSFNIKKDPSDAWKVTQTEEKQDQKIIYGNSEKKTLFLIFYLETGKEIYTTTGNIIFYESNKVISTNSVFHLLDSDSEFRPNYNMLSIDTGAQEKSGTGTAEDKNKQITTEDISNKITKANLIYYLTCVKDILTSEAFLYKTDPDIFKMFLSILMVNVKLTDDLNSNSEFLKELSKHVNNEIVKMPVKNILYVMDEDATQKINPYPVYISGLDLPKIMLKMKDVKFKTIIDNTVAEYSKTIAHSIGKLFPTTKTQLSELSEDKIKLLMEEVYELTKSPKVFVRINVKKIGETENAVNSRFVLKTERSRRYLSVSAVKSAKQLYKIEDVKIIRMDANIEATKEIKFDKATNQIVNEGDGRQLKHVFGEFDGIFNYDMNNKDVANDPKMTKLIDDLMRDKILFIIGYGASGAGKTSSLVYYNKGKTTDERTGIIIQMCLLMNKYGCEKISMKRVELCGQKLDDTKQTLDKKCDDPNATPTEKYDFSWRKINETVEAEEKEPLSFFCDSTDFIEKHPDRILKEQVCSPKEGETKEGETKCPIKNKSLGEVAELLIDKDRHVDATTNNTNSSRSHSLLVVTFYIKNAENSIDAPYEEYNLIIGDFAGVENLFNCTSTKIIKDFANLNKDQTAEEKLENNPTTRYYYNSTEQFKKDRDPVYDFADKPSLFGIVGDKIVGNANVSSEFEYLKDLWINDIYTVLNGFNPVINDYDNLLENAPKNGNLISLFESNKNNNSKTYPIINRFNENGNVTLSTEPFTMQTVVTPQTWKKGNDFYNEITYQGIVINFNVLFKKPENTKDFLLNGLEGAKKYKITYDIFSNGVNLKSLKNVPVKNSKDAWQTDPPDSPGNPTGTYTLVSEKTTTYYQEPPTLTANTYCVAMKTTLKITDKLTCEVPDSTNYTTYYDNYNIWLNQKDKKSIEDVFNAAKDADKIDFTFYVTYAVNDQQIPIKYTLTGPKKSFEVKDNNQKNADKMIANRILNYTVKSSTQRANDFEKTKAVKELFVTDATRILKEIQRFNDVNKLIEPICKERSEEGKYINTELQNLTEAIEAIYIYKNNGRPPLKKPIEGNNDFFYKKHIFNVLNNVSYDEPKLTKVLEKSAIIKAIYNCVTPAKYSYSTFAKAISVVYFCVFSWSCDTEKENKIQYIEINALYNLLQECNYDYELGVDFIGDKQKKYLEIFTGVTTELTTYFTGNNMNAVYEIKDLLQNITEVSTKLNDAINYAEFITSLREIVKKIDDLNATTAVGTLHTVSKIINGVNGDVLQTEDLNNLIEESLEI